MPTRAVDSNKIAIENQNSSRTLIKLNAGGGLPTPAVFGHAACNGEVPALTRQGGSPLGATGFTLSGIVDDEAEVILDALNVADV